jgi:hypothetical protein
MSHENVENTGHKQSRDSRLGADRNCDSGVIIGGTGFEISGILLGAHFDHHHHAVFDSAGSGRMAAVCGNSAGRGIRSGDCLVRWSQCDHLRDRNFRLWDSGGSISIMERVSSGSHHLQHRSADFARAGLGLCLASLS